MHKTFPFSHCPPPAAMESTVSPAAAPASKSSSFVSLSKSKSSSTTSTIDDDHYNINSISSPPFPLSPPPCDKRSSMDELYWKDINLASLHDGHPSTAFRAGPPPILQDFLAGDPPKSRNQSSAAESADAAACSCSLRPPAFTILSLSSAGSGFQNLERGGGGDPARSGAGVTAPPPYFVKTLGPPQDRGLYKRKAAAAGNDGDDRDKRLMKNRESASRSRAKKQAYMEELEVEVAHLQKENAKLRMQQLQLRLALPAAALLPKKTSLRRTLTAPF